MFGKKKIENSIPVAPEASAAPSVSDAGAELIAIIAAAIAAFEGSGASGNGFIVRKISRVTGGTTSWSSAGLNECIDSRRF